MIELILMIASLTTDIERTPYCANLVYQLDQPVVTYKNKQITSTDFYYYLCNNKQVQEYIYKIKNH